MRPGGKRRFRIVEYRAGVKGTRWAQKTSWNTAKAKILRDWKTMLENQPDAKEVVSALREAEKPGAIDYAKIEALEIKIAKEWRALDKLKKELAKCIRNGPRAGERVSSLKIKMDQIEGPNGFIPMIRSLLGEFITLWVNQPETQATIAHIRALEDLKRNPNPRAKKKRKQRPKRRKKK